MYLYFKFYVHYSIKLLVFKDITLCFKVILMLLYIHPVLYI